MILLVARATLHLLASAVALVVSAIVLDGMTLNFSGFIIALLIFTVTGLLVEPLLRQTANRSAPALAGGTALVSTLISLIVTVIVSDGLRISGFSTWIAATVVVWLITLGAVLLLPFVIFRRTFHELRERRRG